MFHAQKTFVDGLLGVFPLFYIVSNDLESTAQRSLCPVGRVVMLVPHSSAGDQDSVQE